MQLKCDRYTNANWPHCTISSLALRRSAKIADSKLVNEAENTLTAFRPSLLSCRFLKFPVESKPERYNACLHYAGICSHFHTKLFWHTVCQGPLETSIKSSQYSAQRSVSVIIPFIVLTILFSGSVFTGVSTVEGPLSVRVSATVKRSLSNCLARMVYTVYKSSTSIQKATRHNYSEVSCCWKSLVLSRTMALQSLSRCSSVYLWTAWFR